MVYRPRRLTAAVGLWLCVFLFDLSLLSFVDGSPDSRFGDKTSQPISQRRSFPPTSPPPPAALNVASRHHAAWLRSGRCVTALLRARDVRSILISVAVL